MDSSDTFNQEDLCLRLYLKYSTIDEELNDRVHIVCFRNSIVFVTSISICLNYIVKRIFWFLVFRIIMYEYVLRVMSRSLH